MIVWVSHGWPRVAVFLPGMDLMHRYRLFALDSAGRVDRGFEQRFYNDDDAIRFAGTIEDAATVEVMRERDIIARVTHVNGRTMVAPAL